MLPSPLSSALAAAFQLQQNGDVAAARAAYAGILLATPRDAAAHFLAATLEFSLGQLQPAIRLLREATRLQADVALYWLTLGVALCEAGEGTDGLTALQQAVTLDAGQAGAWLQYAVALHEAGRDPEAAEAFRRALALEPRQVEAWSGLGRALAGSRPAEAESCLLRALALRPGQAGVHHALASLMLEQDRQAEAEYHARQACRLQPGLAEAHNTLGNALLRLERPEEAAAAYRQALAARPDYPEAHLHLGLALERQGSAAPAEQAMRRALALRPDAAAWLALGNLQRNQGEVAAAMASYRQALACRPDHPEATFNLGTLELLEGDYLAGWAHYEARHDPASTSPSRLRRPDFPFPMWRGEPLAGKRLLLVGEQGYGDQIQFIRLAAGLAARGAQVEAWPAPELVTLFASAPGLGRVHAQRPTTDFDYWCFMLSVPHGLGLIPARPSGQADGYQAYLAPEAARLAAWRSRLDSLAPRGRRVGLVWAGRASHGADRQRSLALADLAPWGELPGLHWFSLQKNAADDLAQAPFPIIALGNELADFADTAAVLQELDLLISVDTAVAHLAGALGRPAWTLLQYAADWRWGRTGEHSAWYPPQRLFRQTAPDDWSPVLRRVGEALRQTFPTTGPAGVAAV